MKCETCGKAATLKTIDWDYNEGLWCDEHSTTGIMHVVYACRI